MPSSGMMSPLVVRASREGEGFVAGAGVVAVQGAGQGGLGVAGSHPDGVWGAKTVPCDLTCDTWSS